MSDQPKDGGHAFPLKGFFRENHGMSLRDYFAAKAMAALLVTPPLLRGDPMTWREGDIARMAFECADAMLAERAKK